MVNIATVNYLPVETGAGAVWPDDIVRLEDGWWPTGGVVDPENDSGLMNWQALQLGQRTEWIRHQLGGIGGIAQSALDIDAISATGQAELVSAAPGNPAPGFAGALVHTEGTGGRARQLVLSDNGRVYSRLRTDTAPTWTAWRRVWDDGDAVSGAGYEILPSGLILQFGFGTADGSWVAFPIAFPNAVLGITFGDQNGNSVANNAHHIGYRSQTAAGMYVDSFKYDGTAGPSQCSYIVIGY